MFAKLPLEMETLISATMFIHSLASAIIMDMAYSAQFLQLAALAHLQTVFSEHPQIQVLQEAAFLAQVLALILPMQVEIASSAHLLIQAQVQVLQVAYLVLLLVQILLLEVAGTYLAHHIFRTQVLPVDLLVKPLALILNLQVEDYLAHLLTQAQVQVLQVAYLVLPPVQILPLEVAGTYSAHHLFQTQVLPVDCLVQPLALILNLQAEDYLAHLLIQVQLAAFLLRPLPLAVFLAQVLHPIHLLLVAAIEDLGL